MYALPFLAVLAWGERRRYGPRERGQRPLALLAGLFFAADLVFWHHAIAAVGAGLGTVLANTQLILVGLAALAVLGEKPGADARRLARLRAGIAFATGSRRAGTTPVPT